MSIDLASLYEITLSPLHYEIERFVEEVVPTPEERIYLQDLTSIVDCCVEDIVGERAQVQPFGSHAMGLSTHDADLDLVILKVIRVHSNGFRVEQKARVIKILYEVAKQLARSRSIKLSTMRVIARARVPVLKIGTKDGRFLDVSIHNESGVKAASFVRKKLKQFPSSLPVILVVKCMLKEAQLNDVAYGGLGGYALTTMVLAHCLELRKMGRPDLDYGDLLLNFLEKFGYDFDFVRQAVSFRHGEVVQKSSLEKETLEIVRNTDAWQGRTNGKPKLFIEDPLTCRNLALGTTDFPAVQKKFRRAFDTLSEETKNEEDILPRLFNVDKAIQRNRGSQDVKDGLLPVKKALKKEGYDRQKAREDIRAFKKRHAHVAHQQRRKRKVRTAPRAHRLCGVSP